MRLPKNLVALQSFGDYVASFEAIFKSNNTLAAEHFKSTIIKAISCISYSSCLGFYIFTASELFRNIFCPEMNLLH